MSKTKKEAFSPPGVVVTSSKSNQVEILGKEKYTYEDPSAKPYPFSSIFDTPEVYT